MNFYVNQPEPNRSCLLALKDLILQSDPEMIETIKYGMPCFCLGKKIICYLWTDKKTREPYILFADGNKMKHPKLETGDRLRMKIYWVNPNEDLPVAEINEVLVLAITLVR
ncbi:MAG: DUF1801 domain-containing protein [Bacteroidetes bacterium]|nr:DUF1801 domain-containing protein [Bacteroidota bacterium]